MASSVKQGFATLKKVHVNKRFSVGLGAQVPEAYRKFWAEWMERQPAAVHYIPNEGRFKRNQKTGEVVPIQNVHIPLKRVVEENFGIWGGEAVIQGFKKPEMKHRKPCFWVPTLKRSAVRSEVLNEFFSVTLTDRTITLIHEHHGFDHYLLKSPACDLRSVLALKIKRKILIDLLNGCPAWDHNKTRQDEVKKEFSQYLEQYTPEEIEWYGLTYAEALAKTQKMIKEANPIVPHKQIFREKLIEQLKQAGLEEVTGEKAADEESSWLKKLNPFSKKKEF
ncbi:hypothetical protein PVAND_005714 [Polypedilum vanderplanki]|uniref:39S ribosomal protein L28, mitochondrial n=1 Tax=Polypedilum vanderplanki TaxID=319348 RepID=A0A9J6C0Z7_POLVA|nr:hypothetical protein PVAND_005714 [Polypedilum vanderplanki]